jgi:hypothetical protein
MNNVVNPFVLKPIKSMFSSLKKPVLVITLTDGAPDSKDDVFQTIKTTKGYLEKSKYGTGACRFAFAQLGLDKRAQQFLADLDDDDYFGDIVDCTSGFEFEQEEFKKKGISLTPQLWVLKLAVGSIDASYEINSHILRKNMRMK